jgi:hypothetical protein
VLPEQAAHAVELVVQSLVVRDDGLNVHARGPPVLQPQLVREQLPFPVAQRRGGVEVSRVQRGLLLAPYLSELPGGVYHVSRGGHTGRRCRRWRRIGLPAPAGQQVQRPFANPGMADAEPGQHLGGDALALAEQAEQEVLGADVVVPELQ